MAEGMISPIKKTPLIPYTEMHNFKYTPNRCRCLLELVVCAILISTSLISANTSKTYEQVAAANFQLAINKFKEAENRLPLSWGDLKRCGKSSPVVEIIEKLKPGFDQKYRFLASDREIRIDVWTPTGGQLSILAMGNAPREPGAETRTGYNGRILIAKDTAGNVFPVEYKEETVEALFRRAGAELSDYTGDKGKWEPEKEERSTGGLEKGNAATADPGYMEPETQRTGKSRQPVRDRSADLPTPSWVLAVVLGIVCVAGILVLVRNHRSGRDE